MGSNKIINFDSVERCFPDYKYGLKENQVLERKQLNLVNNKKEKTGKSWLQIFLANIFSIFNIVPLAVTVAGVCFKHFECLPFLIISILNLGIGLYSDIQTKRLIGNYSSNSNEKTYCVIRNGEEKQISAEDLVLDDVVLIDSGAKLDFCGCILNGEVIVDESLSNGQTHNLSKKVGDRILPESIIISGKAYVKVEQFGQCIGEKYNRNKTNHLNSLGIIKSLQIISLAIIAILIIATVLITIVDFVPPLSSSDSSFKYRGDIGKTLTILAYIVPCGLYLFTSVAYLYANLCLRKNGIFLNKQNSIESFADIDILCVDKTGTITNDKIIVKEVVSLNQNIKDDQVKQIVSNLLIATKDDDEIAKSLKEYFNFGLTANVSKVVPFSNNHKYCAASFKAGNTYVLGFIDSINFIDKPTLLKRINEYESKGQKVLILGKTIEEINNDKIEGGVDAIALIILSNCINEGVVEAFKYFKQKNVSIKIISGDDVHKVVETAKQIGFENVEKFISLEGMSISDVALNANKYSLFGNASPEQKEAIVKSLKEQGKTIAMIGDSVNDTLAMKASDYSVSLGNSNESVKQNSDAVLENSDFNKLMSLATQGRRLSNNLRKISTLYLAKTLVYSLICIVLSSIYLVNNSLDPILRFPFKVNNFILYELCCVGFSSLLLIFEKDEERRNGTFLKGVLKASIPAGIACAFAVISVFILSMLEAYEFTYFDLTNETKVIGVATLVLAIFGLLVLGRTCYKFNKTRFELMCLTIAACLILVAFTAISEFTGFNFWLNINVTFAELTPLNYFEAIVVSAIFGILYLAIVYFLEDVRKETQNEDI